ncbi:FixH family protein [Lysinibacillus sp. NPDC096418]|uniref:FixH family protein n=1 Tax=Lysinibacillus sp. NPDC096418 TaxID=3364138 RepID=UPI00380D77D6
MKKWLLALVAVPALLVGCTEKEKPVETSQDEELQIPEVEILTPKEVAVNEKVELAAYVFQGKTNIDDASVKFEVWESGKRDEGQMQEGVLDKEGVYKADITFDHDGVYFMYAHTTANSIHVMPKQQITAGNPDMTQVLPEGEDDKMNTMDHGKGASDNTEHEKSESNHN